MSIGGVLICRIPQHFYNPCIMKLVESMNKVRRLVETDEVMSLPYVGKAQKMKDGTNL